MEDTNDTQDEEVTDDTGEGTDEGAKAGEGTSKSQEKETESPDAKAIRLLRQTNQARKKLGLPPLIEALIEKPTAKADQKKGFDYAEKAYLKASGIESQDFDFIKEVMDSTGKDIDAVLASKYFQAELKERKDVRMTEAATPSGSKRAGNTTRDTAEYWVSKIAQGTAKITDIPDRKLRQEVVNLRMKTEKNKQMFTDTPVAG